MPNASSTAALQHDHTVCPVVAVQAVWLSDCVLGERSPETRAEFLSQLQEVCIEASPDDAQWLVSRPADNAKAAPTAAAGPQLFCVWSKSKAAAAAAATPDPRATPIGATDPSSQSLVHTPIRCCQDICPVTALALCVIAS